MGHNKILDNLIETYFGKNKFNIYGGLKLRSYFPDHGPPCYLHVRTGEGEPR